MMNNSARNISKTKMIFDKCVYCQKNADKYCARCGDYYCSIACQTKDWNQHRAVCFCLPYEMKKNDKSFDKNISSHVEKLLNNENDKTAATPLDVKNSGNLFRRSVSLPDLTFTGKDFDSTAIFAKDIIYKPVEGMNVEMKILSNEMLHLGYILCIKVEDMRLFDENNLEVNRYCEQATAQNLYVPSYNEVCLVKQGSGVRWRRAVCCSLHTHTASVLLQDYDQLNTVPFVNIKRLPTHLAFPCLTVRCFLTDFFHEKHNEEILMQLRKDFAQHKIIQFSHMKYIHSEHRATCNVSDIAKFKKKNQINRNKIWYCEPYIIS